MLFTRSLSKFLKVSKMSSVATISDYEKVPAEFLKSLLKRLGDSPFVLINLATLDDEFSILNRTVVYRGLIEDTKMDTGIVFVTERNTQKYKNLKENPKTAVTFLLTDIPGPDGQTEIWQIRLIDAEAFELNESLISSFWAEEQLYAKIRSHICECGKPVDHTEFTAKHNKLLKDYENGIDKLEQTKTYTAFKVLAKRWDFYKSATNCIADRVQYRKKTYDLSEPWTIMHVEP